MAIKHAFTSAKSDGADNTIVQPSDWNDNHVIDNDTITYAKIQNVSATDKVLGRSTSGAGDIEEITCTSAGRALIDDADATAQRTTLGLGTMAVEAVADYPSGRLASKVYYLRQDFTVVNQSAYLTAGTGLNSVNQVVAGHPGILRQQVTATATPDRAMAAPMGSGGGTQLICIVAGAGEIVHTTIMRSENESGTQRWSNRWGGIDSNSADCTNGIYFESDLATHGDSNVRMCCASGGSRTKTTMGVTHSSLSTWDKWTYICNAGATSVQGYLNGVAQGSPVTTNIPTTSQSFAAYGYQIIKTLGSSASTVDRDCAETYITFTTPR